MGSRKYLLYKNRQNRLDNNIFFFYYFRLVIELGDDDVKRNHHCYFIDYSMKVLSGLNWFYRVQYIDRLPIDEERKRLPYCVFNVVVDTDVKIDDPLNRFGEDWNSIILINNLKGYFGGIRQIQIKDLSF